MHYFFIRTMRGVAVLWSVAALVAVLALAGCGDDQAQAQAKRRMPPTPVKVVTTDPHTVSVYAKYPGRVQSRQVAQVIGRVTGILESKNFNEGSVVHKGDVLFKIDSRTYQAKVDQRKAELVSAKAALANSARVWKRTHSLYKANAVSQAERDKALSAYQSDKAAVQVAEANLETAQINLDYTTVNAPITGVTSMRNVDIGSLVEANKTQLTTITQLDPVYVLFALPEEDAYARRQVLREMGKTPSDASAREATVFLNNGKVFPYKGKVDFTQSTVDPDTGTVQLRAQVKNPNNRLMPGSYVRVRVRIQTLHNAITVPEKAVVSGQRTMVYVVKDGKAEPKPVELGPLTKQGRVIKKGLSPGEQVVTTGLGTLRPGSPVKALPNTSANKAGADEAGTGNSGNTDVSGAAKDH